MSFQRTILHIAKLLDEDLQVQGFSNQKSRAVSESISVYDAMITNKPLRKNTQKLFNDGHHTEAVEKAYKLIDNTVKNHADLKKEKITGAPLMNRVFSEHNPLLRLNEGITTSECDEQKGYMQVFAGCMTGIRNPRAHEADWVDTEARALQLLIFANHLLERIEASEKTVAK
jgi:uncharacterized protein (TIGR02391 family)